LVCYKLDGFAAIKDKKQMKEKFYYCQREIEGQSECKQQCNHCKEYYYPLEQERKMEDLKEWIESKNPS
jgi:hypothetical protein